MEAARGKTSRRGRPFFVVAQRRTWPLGKNVAEFKMPVFSPRWTGGALRRIPRFI
jgi:hypothetical protein